MAPARDVHVEIGEDYLLNLPGGELYLWERGGVQQNVVPANEVARACVAAAPAQAPPESTVQVVVLGSAGRLALVCSAGELSGPAHARVRAVLASELPDATPVFCSHQAPGVALAVSAPHDGSNAPDPGEIAACVAVMKASFGWDETQVMVIEADGVRCTVEMSVSNDIRDVRVSSSL